MRAYIEAGLRLLRQVCKEGPPSVLHGLDEWRRDSDGVFRLYDREDPFWVECLRRHEDDLHRLAEFHEVIRVLRATPYVSEHCDTLVGTANSQRRIEVEEVADHILWRMARTVGLAFDEQRFLEAFHALDNDLRQRTLPSVWLVPLLGLTATEVPIPLAAGLDIDFMTDEEISYCLRLSIPTGDFPLTARMRKVGSLLAVRLRTDEPKCFGALGQESSTAPTAHAAVRDLLASILDSLRAFKAGGAAGA